MIDPPPPVTGSRRNPTKEDVQALYARLIHSYGPPVDSAAVFAQAVAAAMWEALEVAELAQVQNADLSFSHGQMHAANRVMRRVFDALNPGQGCSAGLRLATRRALCGLTQREVADAGHVERSHYARIESGQYKLKPDHARLFAAVLGCTPEYLLTGEGGRP